MLVLNSLRKVLRILIDPKYDPRITKLIICSSVLMIFSSTTHFVQNIHDVTKVMQSFYVAASYVSVIIKWASLIRNKEIIEELLDSLQVNVDKSKSVFMREKDVCSTMLLSISEENTPAKKFYQSAELMTTNFYQRFMSFIIGCSIIALMSPLGYLFYQFVIGNYTSEIRFIPVALR